MSNYTWEKFVLRLKTTLRAYCIILLAEKHKQHK